MCLTHISLDYLLLRTHCLLDYFYSLSFIACFLACLIIWVCSLVWLFACFITCVCLRTAPSCFTYHHSKTPIPSDTTCCTVTVWRLDSDGVVTVVNYWQHIDYTAIGSSVAVLPAVNNSDYPVAVQSLCSHYTA